jgi:uncharacterized FlaG/YvyC family protein
MTNQITSLGSLPLLAAGTFAPKPVAARPASAPATGSVGKGQGSTSQAVAQVNQHLEQAQTELKLQVDQASGRTVFQVIQQGTGEVVLQVPSEEVLGMSRRVRALEGQNQAAGALVDKKG